jgi:hypothetical protein
MMEIVLCIVGSLFMLFGIFLVIEHANFRKTAYRARGTIVAIEKYLSTSANSRSPNSKSIFYRPVVEYVADGQTYHFNRTPGQNTVKYKLQQSVPVMLARDNPADARLDSPFQLVFGMVFALMGFVTWVVFMFNYHFSWRSIALALIIIGVLGLIVYKVGRANKFKSWQDFKRVYRQSNVSGRIAGSAEDPLLNPGKNSMLFTNQTELDAELNRYLWLAKIISLVFLMLGIAMLAYGWKIYSQQMAETHANPVVVYIMLGMGAVFVLASLRGLVKTRG